MTIIEDENVDRVRSMYKALLRGDLVALEAMFDEDVELEVHGPSTIPFAGLFRGKPALRKFFAIVGEHITRELDDPVPAVQEMIAQGSKVVAIGVDRVRSKSTGQYYDGWWVHLVELREGKIVRLREFIDTASAHQIFLGEPITPGHVVRQ